MFGGGEQKNTPYLRKLACVQATHAGLLQRPRPRHVVTDGQALQQESSAIKRRCPSYSIHVPAHLPTIAPAPAHISQHTCPPLPGYNTPALAHPPCDPSEPSAPTLSPGCASHSRIMVSSLLIVLPLPVGAPNSTLSSVWYSVWNAWKAGATGTGQTEARCQQRAHKCPAV